MASTAHAEERDGLDSSGLPINKGLSVDVVKPPATDDATAMQPKEEGMGEQPVKARKPYTITKQREKWTAEEHEKFLDALKLYGRSWRQIQEHIGTKTAVQIRSHAQKFFSKVVREPAAKLAIEIPPPRPKRKPLHPYPRKSANSSNGANPATGQPKHAPVSSSSGSDQENGGSPVSVLSALQSDAFGSAMSNPSTRCTSPESSDDENNVPPVVSGEEGQQTEIDLSHKETDQDNKDTGMSEEDSSDEVQKTSLKLFGKTVVIPDPRKRCSSDAVHENSEQISQSSTKGTSQAPSAGEVLPAYTAPNGWVLPYNSYPLHLGESAASLHVWWPYYGFPVGHPRGPPSAVPHNEATDESDAVKNPPVESGSDDSDNNTQTASKKWKVLESLGTTRVPRSASSFELKPSTNSAFVRVKPVSGGNQPVTLRCSATRIGSDGGVALAEALGTCTRLKKLDIRDNLFGVEAGVALSKTLPKLHDLVELYLSDLNLENEGTLAITDVLKQSAPQLEILEMAGNEITAAAAKGLAECLTAMQSLKKLTLAENELKDAGAVTIAKSLQEGHPDLKELDVSTNLFQRSGARCLAQAVTNKPGFVLLNINANYIPDEAIDEVKEILKGGKNSLEVLGPLDENDPEGDPEDDDEEENGEEDDDEEKDGDDNGDGGLGSKLQDLKVEEDD